MKYKSILWFIIISIPLFLHAQSDVYDEGLNAAIFSKAKEENKFILLNLKANWCHWCHVMEDSTYNNKNVQAYLNEHYIVINADQDANPALSARYKAYGWPATIFLNSKGEDIVKRAGYIQPDNFIRLLKAIVADPTPESEAINLNSVSTNYSNHTEKLMQLTQQFYGFLDVEIGGFDQPQKYVHEDSYEFALHYSTNNQIEDWLKNSETGALQLVDPEWGGVYQYSTHSDWAHAHYEKLLHIQARYLQIFNTAHQYHDNKQAKTAVRDILDYCDNFLQQDFLYANAQDADAIKGEQASEYFAKSANERRKLGIPTVDTNTYTNSNAALAVALLKMNSEPYFELALNMYQQLLYRRTEDGLFYHNKAKSGLISLRDNIAMAEFLIELQKVSKDEALNKHLNVLMDEIINQFVLENGGFKSYLGDNGLVPQPIISENINLSRLLNFYGNLVGDNRYIDVAQNNLNFLLSDDVFDSYYIEPGILMLAKEIERQPFEVVYYTHESKNPSLKEIYAILPFYTKLSMYNKSNIPTSKKELLSSFNEEVILICTDNFCSSPMYDVADVIEFFKTKPFR